MDTEYFCSVCYTYHKEDKIILSCKGKHSICENAYINLKKYNINYCPICRETIVDKAISDALVLDLISYEIYASRS